VASVEYWKGHTAKMTCDVISFCTGGATILPLASETQIVSALPADVDAAKVVVKGFRVREGLRTLEPETDVLWCGRD
jgi:hypothetical protein